MSANSVHEARPEDATAHVVLQEAIFGETRVMLFAADEYWVSPADAAAALENIANSGSGRRLVATDQGNLVGLLGVPGSPIPRIRHSAQLVIGVLRSHWHCGVGRAPMAEALRWAPAVGLSRLELFVTQSSSRAISLYEHLGFRVEGHRRRASNIDGEPVDDQLTAYVYEAWPFPQPAGQVCGSPLARVGTARLSVGCVGRHDTGAATDAEAGNHIVPDVIPEVTVETLRAFAQAWNRHDCDTLMSYTTEDCVCEASAGPAACGMRCVGRESVRAGFVEVWATFSDAHWGDARHFVHEKRGVSEWTFTGTGADGTRVEVHGCDLFMFRGGRICLKDSYRKSRPALGTAKR